MIYDDDVYNYRIRMDIRKEYSNSKEKFGDSIKTDQVNKIWYTNIYGTSRRISGRIWARRKDESLSLVESIQSSFTFH